jgi:hypothetical protein
MVGAAANRRQMAILYGARGASIIDWVDDLETPAGQATLIVVASVIGALVCFRVASLSGPHEV